jgi:hypothetical protein
LVGGVWEAWEPASAYAASEGERVRDPGARLLRGFLGPEAGGGRQVLAGALGREELGTADGDLVLGFVTGGVGEARHPVGAYAAGVGDQGDDSVLRGCGSAVRFMSSTSALAAHLLLVLPSNDGFLCRFSCF